ncbi:MAG: PAS domain-containing protein [Spirochaetales bacterium]|nr:PAS domain-containing protein [Spirochaetales bacterium]
MKKMLTKTAEKLQFPVIGIGASAGGLEAIRRFFEPVQKDCGMAFIVIVHLMKHRKSEISGLLAKLTPLDVREISDGMAVKPNTVYITPPDNNIELKGNQLFLNRIADHDSISRNIDYCFTSLSNALLNKSICIILSGSLKDGTQGLKAIKDNGGMVMVQDTETAQFDGMPSSAISTGLVDFILPAGDMYKKLANYIQHSYYKNDSAVIPAEDENDLGRIFSLLQKSTGHDFSSYKKNTMQRRINKRMAVIHCESLSGYCRYLNENENEAQSLLNNLLIGVTSFFRDPEVFKKLEKIINTEILEKKLPADGIRIWVPACSTGEEAYTIAIILTELIAGRSIKPEIRIFATDISKISIEYARQGVFQSSLPDNVPSDLTSRYFDKERDVYRVKKNIRNMITFSNHDIIKDPPFSRLDLICCRNLLIYFDANIQNKVISFFHYALNSAGILLLGTSESIGKYSAYFTTLDKKSKIFRKNEVEIKNSDVNYFLTDHFKTSLRNDKSTGKIPKKGIDINEFIKVSILNDYAPVCVIVNDHYEVLYIYGKSGKYFEPPEGEARWNILDISREGLREVLSAGLFRVKEKSERISYYSVKIWNDENFCVADIEIRPVDGELKATGLIMVVIRDTTKSCNEKPKDSNKSNRDAEELQRELSITKEQLQTTIEEFETSNEELKSANEELQSTNEELQSTNEELETSREELQSTNEELQSLLSEHVSKIDELGKLNNDMTNLMASTDIASIFLDNNQLIKRITPATSRFFNILPSDAGRPIKHFVSNLKYEHLAADIQRVIDTLEKKEIEVRTGEDDIYLMRILPYRTTDNIIDGVSITFLDITNLKRALRDKEILIKDIHHRVKNNMSLLVSILGLEKMKMTKNENVPEIYMDSIDNVITRVEVLCRLYTGLYMTERPVDYVNSKLFFIELFDLIKSSCADVRHMDFDLTVEDALIPFSDVVPLGLIVNELVSNSLKHAFPDNDAGRIEFAFNKNRKNEFHLKLKDNGRGFDGNIEELKTGSLGLQLVYSLARQIKGDITITPGQGFCVDIVFKGPEL